MNTNTYEENKELKNQILDIADNFPRYSQLWLITRLDNEVNQKGKLPEPELLDRLNNCLRNLNENDEVTKKIDILSFNDMTRILSIWEEKVQRYIEEQPITNVKKVDNHMEDLKNKIPEIAKEYPDFAKKWIERRLNQEIDSTGQLPDKDTIRNIRDYLALLASLDEKSETIQKLDRISFTGMNTIQEKWHKALAKKAEKLKEFGGKPFEYEPILKCDNGFQWVRLDTPESKDYEGNAMGHCVGSGGYDDNETTIFSLRDKDNIPHVTVEFDEENYAFEQIQGKGNTGPNEKYYYNILKLYEETGATNYDELIKGESYAILNSKVLIGDEAILACPSDTVFDSVNLGKDSKIIEWNYSVKNKFIAENYKLEYVNSDCVFGGNVDISYTKIKEWHCDVPCEFDASGSKLEYVAPDCKFGGSVNINHTNIKEWHCDVPGIFNAKGSNLEYVNPDCKFGSSVNIRETNIKEWYQDVTGNFDAGYSKLEYVNPKCKFSGNIDINWTKIKEWHHDVHGNFDAEGSNLEYVNSDCVFGGGVNINHTKNLKEWHHDVPGYFNISGSKIEYVNPDCVFSAGVRISCTNINEWHCNVPYEFNAESSKLEFVNPDCVFGSDVDIRWTKNLKEWHNDVGGNFDAEDSNLEKIVNCDIKGKMYCNDNVEIITEEKQTMRM